jgi:exosortase/archaeosortase family protein
VGNIKLGLSDKLYNSQVRWFFIKLAILGSVWFVSYHLILKPGRTIDRPLTNFLTASVSKCINVLSPSESISWVQSLDKTKDCAYLVKNDKKVFGIWDVCNGIDLMFIYVGIVVLLPYPAKRKIIFCIAGVIVIIFANIIRITSLYYIFHYHPGAFDFSHHYLFTILMYILIFYGWLLYTKRDMIHKNEIING